MISTCNNILLCLYHPHQHTHTLHYKVTPFFSAKLTENENLFGSSLCSKPACYTRKVFWLIVLSPLLLHLYFSPIHFFNLTQFNSIAESNGTKKCCALVFLFWAEWMYSKHIGDPLYPEIICIHYSWVFLVVVFIIIRCTFFLTFFNEKSQPSYQTACKPNAPCSNSQKVKGLPFNIQNCSNTTAYIYPNFNISTFFLLNLLVDQTREKRPEQSASLQTEQKAWRRVKSIFFECNCHLSAHFFSYFFCLDSRRLYHPCREKKRYLYMDTYFSLTGNKNPKNKIGFAF